LLVHIDETLPLFIPSADGIVASNFSCGCPHGTDPRPQASTWAWSLPPCGHHKWMALSLNCMLQIVQIGVIDVL